MEDLSLHVLDVMENALVAGAERISVRISEASKEDRLSIEVQDDGCGMDESALDRALDPFYTTKKHKRVGLGLALLAQACREADGELNIQTKVGQGTLVRATFRLSHLDLKPLGDMLQSMATLACAHPTVDFSFQHHRNGTVVSQWHAGIAEAGRI